MRLREGKVYVKYSLIVLLCVFLIPDAFAYSYSTKDGWWWYKYQAPETQQPENIPEEKPQLPSERKYPSLAEYPVDVLWNMDPEDFRKVIAAFLDKATKNPTVENVKEYLIVQDIARRKALEFTHVASFVVQTNPDLNIEKDSPIAYPGRVEKYRIEFDEIENTIKNNYNNFALLYFYSPGCGFCEAQDKINKLFASKYTMWEIEKIDVNQQPYLADSLGVTTTPMLILVYRYSQDYIPVATGVTSLDNIEQNILRGIKYLKGAVDPGNYAIYEYQRGSTADPRAILKKNKSNK